MEPAGSPPAFLQDGVLTASRLQPDLRGKGGLILDGQEKLISESDNCAKT